MFLFVTCQFLLRQIPGIPRLKCIHYSHLFINDYVTDDFMLRGVKLHCAQPWIFHSSNWHVCVCVCVCVCCGLVERPVSILFAWPVPGGPGLLYIARGAARVILVWLGGVVHLPNDLREQFVYHGFALGRGLHEGAAPLLGQGLTFAGRHLPLAFQVHLVPHQDHGNLLVPEDRQRAASGCQTHTSDVLTVY